jgi:hypothetical protein
MMAADRELPIRLFNGEIIPTFVMGNETVKVRWDAILVRKFGDGMFDCEGKFQRLFIDSAGYIMRTEQHPVEAYRLLADRKKGTFEKPLVLPPMQPGAAKYQIVTTYWCNPVQKYLFPIINYEESVGFYVMGNSQISAPVSGQVW